MSKWFGQCLWTAFAFAFFTGFPCGPLHVLNLIGGLVVHRYTDEQGLMLFPGLTWFLFGAAFGMANLMLVELEDL